MNDVTQTGKDLLDPLTRRELDILAHLVANRTNQQIAEKESLALSSVKWYVNQIFNKLMVSSRAEAVARAQELRLFNASPAPRNNLPRSLTSFIGREAEIIHLLGLVRAHPLVTVTGSGGAGKTRLALQTAEKALLHFPDGVWLVELAPLADPELLPGAAANAMELKELPGQPSLQSLIDFLSTKHCLILLDNCEHVIAAAAQLARDLLRACPQLHILATSREILGAQGEMAFRCPSLTLPDGKQLTLEELSQVEALRLFVERAQNVSPGIVLTETNAEFVVRICHRLDGIPLAIELAAARLRLLSIEQIAARLDDIFRLLTAGSRTELPRHQTLKALIDWSYNLLNEKEKLLLLRLSVFAGGWTVEGAEEVCSDEALPQEEILDLMGSLIDKSLLIPASGSKSRQSRHTMLETIRQYSQGHIFESGGSEALRERHLDYYLALCQHADPELRGRNLRAWRDLLDDEIDNLRQAVEWALNSSLEKGLYLTGSLTWFFLWRHQKDGVDWLQRLLGAEAKGDPEERLKPERRAARGKALIALNLLCDLSTIDKFSLAREATAIFESLGSDYKLDWALALSLSNPKDPRSLEVIRQAGDLFAITTALWPLITRSVSTGDLVQARIYAEESLALNRQIGYPGGEAVLIGLISWLELLEGDLTLSVKLFNTCQDLLHASGEVGHGMGDYFLGRVALIKGDYSTARQIYGEGVPAAQMIGDYFEVAVEFGGLAWIAWACGDFDLADHYCQDVECLPSQIDDDCMSKSRYVRVRLVISRKEYGLAFERLVFLLDHWYGNLQLYPIQLLIHTFGILAEAQGLYRRAAVLFGAQDFINRQLMNITTPVEREAYATALASVRAALGEVAFDAAFVEGKAMNLEQALDFARDEKRVGY